MQVFSRLQVIKNLGLAGSDSLNSMDPDSSPDFCSYHNTRRGSKFKSLPERPPSAREGSAWTPPDPPAARHEESAPRQVSYMGMRTVAENPISSLAKKIANFFTRFHCTSLVITSVADP